ncbi:uncharacterized protein LOC127241245 [Andrographis paniculata]|uniref:uncharacterized protein LOC127241245 n=1 Tax=Andrographis paniculata TaxID=175694 RepID=UPI0021E810F7|nr:uncharacterized protein LOC127241245 [Andrographis paniculata]
MSNSSSSDDEEVSRIFMESFQEDEAAISILMQNNAYLEQLLNPSQSTHRGSILGHRVINRDRESSDHSIDEYIKIGESTTVENVKRFCRAVVEIFSTEYLRHPNANDISRLLHIGESRGFLGQYAGRSGSPTIILEAVADYDLWI